MTHIRGVVGKLHQRAVKVRVDFGAASEFHLRADVIAALLAEGASATREADFHGYAVADLESGYVGADGCDGAGGLVA